MEPSNLPTEIQKESESYLADLERCESEFRNSIKGFLASNLKKVLLVETLNAKPAVARIVQVLKQLEEDHEDQKVSKTYLSAENQASLSWERLLRVLSPKRVSRFKNLLVCEFSQSVQIQEAHGEMLKKLIDRLNVAVVKKAIFVTSQKDLLNEYLTGIELRAVLKIDEFGSELTSMIGADETKALIEASFRGRVNDVAELLKRGVDVNVTCGSWRSTALHAAAENGHTDVVLILLRNGANMMVDTFLFTPLHIAARRGHNNVALVLLENDVDVDRKGFVGRTALHDAASGGHNDVVRSLLEYGANVNAGDVPQGNTALHLASQNNHVEVLLTLMNYGADLNANDSCHQTPLHGAVQGGHLKIVEALIETGADVNVMSERGLTALDLAKRHNLGGIVELLIKSHNK